MQSKSVLATILTLAAAGVASSAPLDSPSTSTGLARRWLPSTDKIRGVNLGSQFIIEPWMAWDEWNSMGCGNRNDEWQCVEALGQDAADAAFRRHWDTWTTQDDIWQIKSLGLNTVRIPVGFWIYERLVKADEHFPRGGLAYLDRLVGWCRDAGLYVIMDLHAGPGGQTTRQQFTGHSVDYPGFYTQENYERTYQFLEWMAERIHTNDNYRTVGTLQVMNEPVHSSEYPDLAANMVANFYPGAWTRIRDRERQLGVADNERLHIQMMGIAWGSGNPSSHLPDTSLALYDDHRYYKWDPSVTTTKDGYISAVCRDYRGGSDIIMGEWSLAVADSVQSNGEFEIRGRPDQVAWYRKYWAAQAQAFERSGGWVFWTWKCNWIGGFDEWRWCYQSAVAAGVIPRDAGSASQESPC
ncbi:glycoside hydrolase family 5 protein [Durotheca rogersii]|uniref:glycoside hydrolase family 5 protein n=1 Tax=Durotheca rogersii TaxID=419775 RepID=UPI00222086C2|nr:glycoside hydrolase family 5 protein [Durotheca rogersii]KAI5866045.1 glycoside hydrolase family 5 protein [Durotheca rogersii]